MANYVSQYTGAELDNSILFGKNPDAEPTENSNSGAKSGGIWTAIRNLASSISGKQAKITASGMLKGDGNGGVSAGTEYTDYLKGSSCVSTPSSSNKVATLQQGGQMIRTNNNNSGSITATVTVNQYMEFSGSPTSINLTLGARSGTGSDMWTVAIYVASSLSLTVTPPSSYIIVWKDGTPTFSAGKYYEISFFYHNGRIFAVCAEF